MNHKNKKTDNFITRIFLKLSDFLQSLFVSSQKHEYYDDIPDVEYEHDVRESFLLPEAEHTKTFDTGTKPSKKTPPTKNTLALARKKREALDNVISKTSSESKRFGGLFVNRKRPRSFLLGTILTTFKLVLVLVLMLGAGGLGSVVGLAQAYMETTPSLDTNKIVDQAVNSYLYDSNGKLITTFVGTENREWATLAEIPFTLQEAFIAVEDVRFNYHNGVDLKRLFGAVANNFLSESVHGGSTLTQQLIKNRLLTSEQTYKRKIQEAYLAIQLEEEYSKDEILEAYLNTIPLGGMNYGVKAAAQDYFGKKLNELSLRESACIAGLTQSPYKYDPRRAYYVTMDTTAVNERTDIVLKRMYTANFITKEEYEAALKEELKVVEKSAIKTIYKYPYFVEYVVNDVIDNLLFMRNMANNPQNRAIIEDEMRVSGYSIYTTLDSKIQQIVQETLSTYENYPAIADENDSVVKISNPDGTVAEIIQPQAAAVVYDHEKGELKAIIGGRDEAEVKKSLNRTYQTTMPVGSSIKPIAVYAPAIDLGYSPATPVANIPVPIPGWNTEAGFPAISKSSYGPVSLRKGLTSSLNTAAARTLMDYVGINESKNYLIELGVNPDHINADGPGLALGTSGITPIEMAVAFGAIANKGEYLQPFSFSKVFDKNGEVLLDVSKIRVKRQVFKPSTAYMITSMLIDAVKIGTGKQAAIDGMSVGGKTGTNQDNRGVFFAGITPYYTATLWVGHDNYKPLAGSISAASTSAPLWQAFMSKILEGMPDKPIIAETPAFLNIIEGTVCGVSGMLPTEICQNDFGKNKTNTDMFLNNTLPTEECTFHHAVAICQASNQLATPFCPIELQVPYNLVVAPDEISPYNEYPQINGDFSRYTMPELRSVVFTEDAYADTELKSMFCYTHNLGYVVNGNEYALNSARLAIANAQNYLYVNEATLQEFEVMNIRNAINELENEIANPFAQEAQLTYLTNNLLSLLGDHAF